MKAKLLLVSLFMAVVASANAQFTSGGKSSSSHDFPKYYNRLTVGYEGIFLSEDSPTMNGVSLQYTHGFGLGDNPMYIELGLGGAFSHASQDDETLNYVTIKVPVNFSYRIYLGEEISIAPYAGFNCKFHAMGKWDDENIFQEGSAFKRFQAGWQVGLGFNFSKFYAGAQFGTDFIPLASEGDFKINSSCLGINIGFNF